MQPIQASHLSQRLFKRRGEIEGGESTLCQTKAYAEEWERVCVCVRVCVCACVCACVTDQLVRVCLAAGINEHPLRQLVKARLREGGGGRKKKCTRRNGFLPHPANKKANQPIYCPPRLTHHPLQGPDNLAVHQKGSGDGFLLVKAAFNEPSKEHPPPSLHRPR